MNEPRKVQVNAVVPDCSDDSEDSLNGTSKGQFKRKNSKGKAAVKESKRTVVRSGTSNFRKKKEVIQVPVAKKEDDFARRHLENEVLNPYLQLLRVDDLLATVENPGETLSSLEIVLLRYNSVMTDIFKEYKGRQSNLTEVSCALTMRELWQLIKDARMLSPGLSLYTFNKCYFENPENRFHLSFNLDEIRTRLRDLKLSHYEANPRKLETLKKLDVYLRNKDVEYKFQRIDYDNFDESLSKVDQDHWSQLEEDDLEKQIKQQAEFMRVQQFDVHSPQNVVQFRNFIDGLIRCVYIREGLSFKEIAKNFEKYMQFRIKPLVHEKANIFDPAYPSEEATVRKFIRDYNVEDDAAMKALFERNQSKPSSKELPNEQVSDIRSLMSLLKRSKLMEGARDEFRYFKIVERYFDPDSSYIDMKMKQIEMLKHFNRQQTLELAGSNDLNSIELDPNVSLENPMPNVARKNTMPDTVNTLNEFDDKMKKMNQFELIEEIEEESHRSENFGKKGDQVANRNLTGSLENIDAGSADVSQRNYETKAMTKMLNKVLGHQLLYFEFVENLVLYLYVTVSDFLSRIG